MARLITLSCIFNAAFYGTVHFWNLCLLDLLYRKKIFLAALVFNRGKDVFPRFPFDNRPQTETVYATILAESPYLT